MNICAGHNDRISINLHRAKPTSFTYFNLSIKGHIIRWIIVLRQFRTKVNNLIRKEKVKTQANNNNEKRNTQTKKNIDKNIEKNNIVSTQKLNFTDEN